MSRTIPQILFLGPNAPSDPRFLKADRNTTQCVVLPNRVYFVNKDNQTMPFKFVVIDVTGIKSKELLGKECLVYRELGEYIKIRKSGIHLFFFDNTSNCDKSRFGEHTICGKDQLDSVLSYHLNRDNNYQ